MTYKSAGVMYFDLDNNVLLLKRAYSSENGGTWAPSGGKIDPGESTIDAAIRESHEEIDHRPSGQLLEVPANEGFCLYTVREKAFHPLLNDEHLGFVWARIDDLPQPLHPGVDEEIKAAYAILNPQKGEGMDESHIDINGWKEVKDNPLSKVGVFPYLGKQLPNASDPNKLYRVYRPAEELGSQECIDSFKLLPWVDEHVMLGSLEDGLTPAEQKGVQGVIGEDVYFKDNILFGNIKVFSETLADQIEAGKRELSCGYRCKYEWSSGSFEGEPYDVIQRDIRGNHLALVEAGRMGPDVAVMDSLDKQTLDSLETPNMGEENTGGASSGQSLEELLATFTQFLPIIQSIQQHMTATKDANPAEGEPVQTKEPVATDAEPKEPEKKEEEKPAAAMDEAAITRKVLKSIAERDSLAKDLSAHVGTFDHADMDLAGVVKYGMTKLNLNAPAGQEIGALKGYLAAASAIKANQPVVTAGMDSGTAKPAENALSQYRKKVA